MWDGVMEILIRSYRSQILSIRKERGASLLEMAIILGLFVVVMLPAFWVMYDKYSKEDLTSSIQASFESLQDTEVHYVTLDITAIQAPRIDCLQSKLQNISDAMATSTGSSGFCSIFMIKDDNPAAVLDIGGLEMSSDETGANCGPPPQALLDLFESSVTPDLPDGTEYGAGIYWMTDPEIFSLLGRPFGAQPSQGGGAGLGPSGCTS